MLFGSSLRPNALRLVALSFVASGTSDSLLFCLLVAGRRIIFDANSVLISAEFETHFTGEVQIFSVVDVFMQCYCAERFS